MYSVQLIVVFNCSYLIISLNIFFVLVELSPEDRYNKSNDKTNIKLSNPDLSNIVKVNNSKELNSFILNFIEESGHSQTGFAPRYLNQSDSNKGGNVKAVRRENSQDTYDFVENLNPSIDIDDVSAETRLEAISRRLSSYISNQSLNAPKTFNTVSDSSITPSIGELLEKSTEPQDPTTNNEDETTEDSPVKDENQIVEVYINGVPIEEPAPVFIMG